MTGYSGQQWLLYPKKKEKPENEEVKAEEKKET